MATPSPPNTDGNSSFLTYSRNPGLLIRFMLLMTGAAEMVFQRNGQHRQTALLRGLVALYVALVLQHSGDCGLDPGAGHSDRDLVCRQAVTYPGQHICNRICHHIAFLYQLAFATPGASPFMHTSRSMLRLRPNFL